MDSYQDALTESSIAAFRSALVAMAECGRRAAPGADINLEEKLDEIRRGLTERLSPAVLNNASQQVNSELSEWAESAFRHHEENEREIREIIGAVARTAESVGDRDEKYAREIGELAANLRSIADLNDVATIRRSIIESTKALKLCVEKMADDSRNSVAQLKTQVADYRSKLEESERVSAVDSLTGLANRRKFEHALARAVSQSATFCLLMIDMNDFKGVNDTHGHIAGDDLLRQFAAEMKAQFGANDLVARWGGDEFAVIAAGNLAEGQARAERVRRWALGEYKINTGNGAVKLKVSAAIGIVERTCHETGLEILARADKNVYRDKESMKATNRV